MDNSNTRSVTSWYSIRTMTNDLPRRDSGHEQRRTQHNEAVRSNRSHRVGAQTQRDYGDIQTKV